MYFPKSAAQREEAIQEIFEVCPEANYYSREQLESLNDNQLTDVVSVDASWVLDADCKLSQDAKDNGYKSIEEATASAFSATISDFLSGQPSYADQ